MPSHNLIAGIAGAVGGVISQAITYPLYTITVRIQTSSANSNVYGTLLKIIDTEGIKGLYPGLNACLIAVTIQSAVYYYWFSVFNRFHKLPKVPSPLWSLLIGAEAGVLTVLLTNPLWVVNAYEVTATTPTNGGGWLATARCIYKEKGLSGFLSGLGPALLLVCNPAMLFWFYSFFTHRLMEIRNKKSMSGFDYFVLGWLGKVASTVATYPIQTIKMHMQKAGETDTTLSACEVVRKLIGKQGQARGLVTVLSILYRGISSKLLQTGFTSAILFLCREKITAFLERLLLAHVKQK